MDDAESLVSSGSTAGIVVTQESRPDEGKFRATIRANRQSVVLLKASYTPRWNATVDGHDAPIQLMAPGFVGIPVRAGAHKILFTYQSVDHYWLLFVSLAAVALTVYFERRKRQRVMASGIVGFDIDSRSLVGIPAALWGK